MPRLPHRKYAQLHRRWEAACAARSRIEREMTELLHTVRPKAIPQERWEHAVLDSILSEEIEKDFANSLTLAMLDVGERAE
jgi:fatty acid desaturase